MLYIYIQSFLYGVSALALCGAVFGAVLLIKKKCKEISKKNRKRDNNEIK
jgi:hypothetical protein